MTKIVIETDQEIESLTINFAAGGMKTTTRPASNHTSSVSESDDWEEPLEFSKDSNFKDTRSVNETGAEPPFGNAPVANYSEPARASEDLDVNLDSLIPSNAPKELPSIAIPDVSQREIPAGAEGMSDEEL